MSNLPLILCGTPKEVEQFDFSEATLIYLPKEKEESYNKADLLIPCPSLDNPNSDVISTYVDSLLDLRALIEGCNGETIVFVSEKGIFRGPTLAMAIRALLFEGDTYFAVASQVAQRPQCQPSKFLSRLADQVFEFEGKLYQSVKEYLDTGMAISSTGETFHYDSTGEGKSPSEDAKDFLESFNR